MIAQGLNEFGPLVTRGLNPRRIPDEPASRAVSEDTSIAETTVVGVSLHSVAVESRSMINSVHDDSAGSTVFRHEVGMELVGAQESSMSDAAQDRTATVDASQDRTATADVTKDRTATVDVSQDESAVADVVVEDASIGSSGNDEGSMT
jgi:hypothetical protein